MRAPLRVVVEGRSMLPALASGDRVLALRVAPIRRDDVWVVRHAGTHLVKRIVGLPGDRVFVSEGRARISGGGSSAEAGPQRDGSWVLGPDEYLAQGDNQGESTDLRAIGPHRPEDLVGRVVIRYWPRPGLVR